MYVGHQASGLLVRAGRNAIPTTSKTGPKPGGEVKEKRSQGPKSPRLSFLVFFISQAEKKNPANFISCHALSQTHATELTLQKQTKKFKQKTKRARG
jgi:hypothetical protein